MGISGWTENVEINREKGNDGKWRGARLALPEEIQFQQFSFKKAIPFDVSHFLDKLIKDLGKELQNVHLVRELVVCGSSSLKGKGKLVGSPVAPCVVTILKANSMGWGRS